MTGLASSLSAASVATFLASSALDAAMSSSKYLPCRTPSTEPNPSVCNASATVVPWGSKTEGLRVTNTRTRISSVPDQNASFRRGASRFGAKHTIEDVIHVAQLLAQIEGPLDLRRRE